MMFKNMTFYVLFSTNYCNLLPGIYNEMSSNARQERTRPPRVSYVLSSLGTGRREKGIEFYSKMISLSKVSLIGINILKLQIPLYLL